MEKTITSNLQSPQKTLPETCERIVAFLDIMGFKDMVARQDESNIKNKLDELSNFITDAVSGLENAMFYIFSDSIIIFAGSSNHDAFRVMAKTVGAVVEKAISLGLPIKGAMAKGKCTVSVGYKPFYFGQPIIDAYTLEENMVLYGVALHNSLEEDAALPSDYVFDYKLPLKGGASKHFLVNWFGNNLESNQANLQKIRKTVSDSPRRYIDNTEDSISYWKKLQK